MPGVEKFSILLLLLCTLVLVCQTTAHSNERKSYLSHGGRYTNDLPELKRQWPEPENVDSEYNLATILIRESLRFITATYSHYAPPMISRNGALIARIMFESLVPYQDNWKTSYPHSRPLRRLKISDEMKDDPWNQEITMAYATYKMFDYVYGKYHPEEFAKTTSLFERLNIDTSHTCTDNFREDPADLGVYIATQMILMASEDRTNADGSKLNDFSFDDSTNLGRYIDFTNYVPINPVHEPIREPVCKNIIRDMNHWSPVRIPDPDGGSHVQTFLATHFSQAEPFAVNPMDIIPPPPPLLGSDETAWNIEEMLDVMYYSGRLGDKEKIITEVHADGFMFGEPHPVSPSAQWMYFSMLQAVRHGLSLTECVELFFLQGMAQYDAGIATRVVKRFYDFIRPITRIQCSRFREMEVLGWKGYYQGVGKIKMSQFLPYMGPYFIVPAFAEYVSGHSTFAGAGAEVLTRFFGSSSFEWGVAVPEGESLYEPKITAGEPGFIEGLTNVPNQGKNTKGYTPAKTTLLYWDTYWDYANQDGISRLHGGVHFASGDTHGRKLGRQVAGAGNHAGVWDRFVYLTGYEAPSRHKKKYHHDD